MLGFAGEREPRGLCRLADATPNGKELRLRPERFRPRSQVSELAKLGFWLLDTADGRVVDLLPAVDLSHDLGIFDLQDFPDLRGRVDNAAPLRQPVNVFLVGNKPQGLLDQVRVECDGTAL